MSANQQSIADIWNNLYCNDSIELVVHKEDIETLRRELPLHKHRQLKDTEDTSRLKITTTVRIGEEDWYDVTIKLLNSGYKTIRTKEPAV